MNQLSTVTASPRYQNNFDSDWTIHVDLHKEQRSVRIHTNLLHYTDFFFFFVRTLYFLFSLCKNFDSYLL